MCSSDPQIKTGESSDQVMQALIKNYPQLSGVINAGAVPDAQANLAATEATYPQMQELGLKTDLANVEGTGGELAAKATELDKATNPEFYSTRTASSNTLSDLFKSINLSGDLTGGEQSAIERGNNRANINSGISTPTPTSAVSAAMNYGNASTAKKLAQQGVAAGAVGAASGALPAMRSPIDPFQIATGRSSTPASNPGLSTATSVGMGLDQSLTGLASSAMDANTSRRSGFEKFMGAMPSYSG